MKYWQVDAFTSEPFKGNPAAVFVLKDDISNAVKQNIAQELNLSETAFVHLNDNVCEIKWFTPESEVDLCGHATLAASHILWEQGLVQSSVISFESKSGILKVTKLDQGYCLDFPLQPSISTPDQKLIEDILGREAVFVGSNGHDAFAIVDDAEFVRKYEPDTLKIFQLEERGFLLSAKGDDQYDYIYRAFFPKLGIKEDPVTGSANTVLAAYWSDKLSKTTLKAFQASRRTGELLIEVQDGRVLISGPAVTVCEAQLKI